MRKHDGGILVPLAKQSETALRRLTTVSAAHAAFRLASAWLIVPGLTAVERFLEARSKVFSERGWV
jgi:hypothetical protein